MASGARALNAGHQSPLHLLFDTLLRQHPRRNEGALGGRSVAPRRAPVPGTHVDLQQQGVGHDGQG